MEIILISFMTEVTVPNTQKLVMTGKEKLTAFTEVWYL